MLFGVKKSGYNSSRTNISILEDDPSFSVGAAKEACKQAIFEGQTTSYDLHLKDKSYLCIAGLLRTFLPQIAFMKQDSETHPQRKTLSQIWLLRLIVKLDLNKKGQTSVWVFRLLLIFIIKHFQSHLPHFTNRIQNP